MKDLIEIAGRIYEQHPIQFWPWLALVVVWLVVLILMLIEIVKLILKISR